MKNGGNVAESSPSAKMSGRSKRRVKRLRNEIVYQGLIRTCSHPPVIEVGDSGVVATETTDILGNRRPSYKDYVDLWIHILDPTKLKGHSLTFLDPGTRKEVHSLMYDEVVGSVIKIVHRLDLTAKTSLEQEPEAAESADDSSPPTTNSDPVSGLYPSVPKDFQIFINLVDLCKSLFPCVQPSLFSQWVPTFGREMIVHSTAHPSALDNF